MDQIQESDKLKADAEMAITAPNEPAGTDSFDQAPLEDTGDHHETHSFNDNQAADVENPDVFPAPDPALTGEIENQATDSQPQQVHEMGTPSSVPAKRARGRPRKNPLPTAATTGSAKNTPVPSNIEDSPSIETPPPKKRRGRPPKNNGNKSLSTATTPYASAASEVVMQPLSTPRRNLRVPTADIMDSEEDWHDTAWSPINGRQQAPAAAAAAVEDHAANGDAFGPDLKSKLRQALFINGLEYSGGLSIPEDLAQSLHHYFGAGLPVPRGELFIRADLAEELRNLFL